MVARQQKAWHKVFVENEFVFREALSFVLSLWVFKIYMFLLSVSHFETLMLEYSSHPLYLCENHIEQTVRRPTVIGDHTLTRSSSCLEFMNKICFRIIEADHLQCPVSNLNGCFSLNGSFKSVPYILHCWWLQPNHNPTNNWSFDSCTFEE